MIHRVCNWYSCISIKLGIVIYIYMIHSAVGCFPTHLEDIRQIVSFPSIFGRTHNNNYSFNCYLYVRIHNAINQKHVFFLKPHWSFWDLFLWWPFCKRSFSNRNPSHRGPETWLRSRCEPWMEQAKRHFEHDHDGFSVWKKPLGLVKHSVKVVRYSLWSSNCQAGYGHLE